jgi:transcriptional regulator with GAF, ATPase, and Fis domain
VAVNCTALPENLLEAELSGHTRGAFTGALQSRIGRFERANGGTIFLDEIGDLPLDLQGKLLRVLQERELQRLGSSETFGIDVRVVAATNCDRSSASRKAAFAKTSLPSKLDPLAIPALRQRRADTPILSGPFTAKICAMKAYL